MTVLISKPSINLREALKKSPSGIAGEAVLRSDTEAEAREALSLDNHETLTVSTDGVIADFESTGIDDNATSTAITIDSSENVGIGTSSPAYPLDVRTTVSTIAGFYGDNALLLVQNKSTGVLTLNGGGTGDSFAFETAGSEAMRITSSGILLVGTTDTTNTTLGCKIAVDGTTIVHTDASGFSQPLLLNRQDSDGTLLTFRQANSTVGAIGVQPTSNLFIGGGSSGGTGIRMNSGAILPCTGDGTLSDGSKELGAASYRWKDLYLSGGVYLGGTGAANLLDDYETGTWTPTLIATTTDFDSVTYDSALTKGMYTKIGNIVIASCSLMTDSVTVGAAAGSIAISGLPFTSDSNYFVAGSVANTLDWPGEEPSEALVYNNQSRIDLFYKNAADGNSAALAVADVGTGANDNRVYVTVTYRVS